MILSWVVIFLIIALAAGFLGFGGVAHESAWIAKILFVLFLVLFLFSWAQDNGWIDTDFRLFSSEKHRIKR